MKKRLLLAGIVILGLIGLILVPSAKKTDRIPKPGKPILTSYRGGHTLRPVEIDGQECYIFQSYDRKKTSDIYYRTQYLQISRIQDNIKNPSARKYKSGIDNAKTNGDPHQYFKNNNNRMSFLLDMKADSDPHSYTDPGDPTHVISTWVFTRDKIDEKVGKFDGDNPSAGMKNWKKEIDENIENGTPTWMGLDAIISIFHDSKAQGGYHTKTKQAWGKCYNWSSWSRGYVDSHDRKMKSLIDCEGWKYATKNSFQTHYDKYFKLKNPAPPPEEKPTESTSTYYLLKNDAEGDTAERTKNVDVSESNHSWCAPNLYTYNHNKVGLDGYSKFDLQEGIPTTEHVTNGVDTDRWYGSVKLKKTTATVYVSVPIHTEMNLSWSNYYDAGSDVVKFDDTKTYKATVEYWTLNSVKLYELQQTTISNDCFANTLEYLNTEKIPWRISLNGRVYSSKTDTGSVPAIFGTYEPTRTTHLSKPKEEEIPTINIYVSGSGRYYGDAYIQAKQAADEKTKSEFNGRARAGEYDAHGHNDLLELNGTRYSGDGNLHSKNGDFLGTKEFITRTYNADGYLEETASFRSENKFKKMPSGALAYDIDQHVKVPITTDTAYSDTVTETQHSKIPQEKLNGPYYTTIASHYSRIITGLSLKDAYPSLTNEHNDITCIQKGTAPAVKESSEEATQVYARKPYTSYEPIFVHSPAIAPISIKGEGSIQAMDYKASSNLILDNTYTVRFDWKRYIKAKGYNRSAGWEKYIKKKQVRFPFDVESESLTASGARKKRYFHVDEATGYTDWITVGMEYPEENHYISAGDTSDTFRIYIPSWAKEGVYGAHYDQNPVEANPIQVKVYANNYDPELGFYEKEEANTRDESDEYPQGEPNTYVATYAYDVQVSGVMYGFQVNAISDELEFGGVMDPLEKDSVYSFVNEGFDKKVGRYNRFTEDRRYLRDTAAGKSTTAWSYVNTLPFANGKGNVTNYLVNGKFESSSKKSEVMFLNGLLKAGQEFSFLLRTMATAYDTQDALMIQPTYRYVDHSGRTDEDIDFYYRLGDQYIKLDSKWDREMTRLNHLNGEYYENCYGNQYYDTIKYTAQADGRSENSIQAAESLSYSVGEIRLNAKLRLLTGDEEELRINRTRSRNNVLRYPNTIASDKNLDLRDPFQKSMQTWYGKYLIPGRIYVCKKGTDIVKWGQENGGFKEDSALWLKDGYLVLNFDIETDKAKEPPLNLSYFKNGLDMWNRENGGEHTSVVVEDLSIYQTRISLRSGDVAVIRLDETVRDDQETRILYLN